MWLFPSAGDTAGVEPDISHNSESIMSPHPMCCHFLFADWQRLLGIGCWQGYRQSNRPGEIWFAFISRFLHILMVSNNPWLNHTWPSVCYLLKSSALHRYQFLEPAHQFEWCCYRFDNRLCRTNNSNSVRHQKQHIVWTLCWWWR